MSMSTKWLFSLLAGSVLGALLFSLWRVNRDPAPALAPSALAGELPAFAEPVPPEPEAVETSRAPASLPEPVIEPTTAPAPAEATPAELREPSESWRAIQQMLANQEFLDACARPTETASAKLKVLVADADRAIQSEVQEVVIARLEAGLFERIPGYVQGEPYTVPNWKDSLYRSFVSTGTGDAGWVVLERVDHRELYALSDRMKLLEAELEARERAQ